MRQPTIFLDLSVAPKGTKISGNQNIPSREQIETELYKDALVPLLEGEKQNREKEIKTISEHMEISLTTIIDRVQLQFAQLQSEKESGSQEQGLDGRIRIIEDKLDELNNRLELRRSKLEKERQCTISNIQNVGSAWVLPHPERETAVGKKMVNSPEIEQIAIKAVTEFEESRGWKVQSVEAENRGFDLISRKPHTEDPLTAIEVRFIEVKGRAHIGEVALTTNEFKTAERLKKDFWLYVVFNCESEPELHMICNPARLGWKPIVKIEHYHVDANEILISEMNCE